MKGYDQLLIWVFIFFLACSNHQENIVNELGGPKVVEAKPYIVSIDSLPKPLVSPAGAPVIVKAVPARIVPSKTNVRSAGNPRIVEAGLPKISTPGEGNYSVPKIVPAIDSPFYGEIPETVIAKEAYTKDQNPQNFSSFDKLQGLRHSLVTCLLQDRNGNLWFGFGTQGVSKYDGKTFAHFTGREGWSNSGVFCLLEDKSGNIWFGTDGDGVIKYDGKKITHFGEKQGLVNNTVKSMCEDRNGNVWFGTKGGVAKYDGKTFTHFTEKEGLSNNFVLNITEDKKGNLWFGTFSGGVCKYDGKRFSCFTTKEGLTHNSVFSIAEDRNGNIWFGTSAGVNKYDGKNFFHFTKKEGLVDDNVFSILPDASGNLWFGTHGGGISKYDGKAFTNFTEKDGLSNNIVWQILEDQHRNLWFATMGGGINKFNGGRFTHFTENDGLTSKNVQTILQDSTGNIWFGTFQGLTKYDGKNFTQFLDKRGITYNDIWSITEDKKGNVWFGTYGGGVIKYDGKMFTQFTTSQGLGNDRVWSMAADRKGNLWFGTGGSGMDKYDGKTFTHFTKKQGLPGNVVSVMLEDNKGNLWIGTDSGVCRYDGKTFTGFTMSGGLSSNDIRSIIEDSNGNLWFGTGTSGVNKYDGKTFTHFTEKEGLSSNIVFSMLKDKKGNLLFGTSLGFDKLEKDKVDVLNKAQKVKSIDRVSISDNYKTHTGFFKSYTHEEGFSGIGVNIGKNIFEDKNGTVWVGANGMLTAFHQDNEIEDTLAPNLQLTGLQIFDEKIPWLKLEKTQDTVVVLGNGIAIKNFDFQGLSKWYALPENLKLAYNNNKLTFEFVGITLNTPKKVRYQYILEGLDKNWSALTSRTEAPYGNLPFGNYVFKVRAMNGEGYWSKELSYAFTIRPPWWHTWWAYGVYTLLFLTMLMMIHRYQKKRIIRKEEQKAQRKELEHAKEIEKAYTKLQETQAQLIQSEKMASLGELTAGIAHEIQNPLNFVNNFSEINADLIDELKIELKNGKDNDAILIADSIKENEQKINHHGKRAEAIVKGMLLHSRTNSGVKEPVEINGLVDEYIRLAYHGMRAKDKEFNVTINTHFDKNVERVNIAPQDVGRVVLNLMNNAFYSVSEKKKKNSNGFEPAVFVATKKSDGKIEIIVKDNGTGIPQKVLDKIFQPFFTTKPAGQGTGLGLSLSYDIIKAHGGELKVESIEGEYSEFVIHLPV